jgi:aryl-alcohol dehydrogenase-like predicted oxidoreductase
MYDILQSHGIQLASNQVEYSLLRTLPEDSGLFAAMKERGVALLACTYPSAPRRCSHTDNENLKDSPLGQGRLTGKYSAANPPPSGRRFSNMPMAQLEPLLETMRTIGKKYDVPVSAVALNWVICKSAIPLGGARNREQAEQVGCWWVV